LELNSRDVAYLILFGGLAAYAIKTDSFGGIAFSFVRVLANRVVIEVGLLILTWTSMVVLAAQRFGLWNAGLLHDTVLAIVPAGSLLLGAPDAAREDGWYRRKLRHAFALTVVVEVLAQLTTYPLPVEVALVTIAFLASILATFAGTRYDTSNGLVPRLASRVMIGAGLLVIAGPILYLTQNAGTLDWGEVGLRFALPIWLTVLTLPVAVYFGAVCEYEWVFLRLKWWAMPAKPSWRHRAALVLVFNIRTRPLDRFARNTNAMRAMVETTSLREAVRVALHPPAEPTYDDDDQAVEPDDPPDATQRRRKRRPRQHGRRRSH
jgi:hypothetical protein